MKTPKNQVKSETPVSSLASNSKATDPKSWTGVDFDKVQAIEATLVKVLRDRKADEIARLKSKISA